MLSTERHWKVHKIKPGGGWLGEGPVISQDKAIIIMTGPIKTGPVKVWSIGGGSQMLVIIWPLTANIKFILMSPEE